MKKEYPDCHYVLGDIRDISSLFCAFVGHDVVIHAAANKHIPACEDNVAEAITVNVQGSINVAMAAIEAGIKQVVGISTDKVCYPVNTYGNTKALMERVFIEFNRMDLTSFHLCRYGNVLGSNGSVLDVWQRQLDSGELPTLTDPDMTRFWLSEDDAVDLVEEAMSTQPGVIVIPAASALSMGKFAEYFGITEFDIVGKRPGEKQHECLITKEERAYVQEPYNNGYFYLYPASEGIINGSMLPYTSLNPIKELTKEELLRMVSDD
jgi:UDP-N-acetylglucosamine 4,6-dehydratase